jgi:hypothetical protein
MDSVDGIRGNENIRKERQHILFYGGVTSVTTEFDIIQSNRFFLVLLT